MTAPPNLHACAVVLGRTGLLVTGPSGAGKTRLSLDLVEHCRRQGLFARLVGDDQLFLSVAHGRLVATAPAPIAGLVELRGFGPAPVAHLAAAVIDRLVRLVPAEQAPRLADPARETLLGVAVPRLDVTGEAGPGGVRAVAGWLGLPPFDA